jgi:hypothetical protein
MAPEERPQKTWLQCPCGTVILAKDEDDLVEQAQSHIAERHPDMVGLYEREHILFIAR